MSLASAVPFTLSPQSMADLLCSLIILCRGRDGLNNPIWAYLCIKPSMAAIFKEARERGGIELADYGTILESGEGEDPPSNIMRRMERDYAVNHQFEQDLLDAVAANNNDSNKLS